MDSLQAVRSIEGDTIDKICQRYLGFTADVTEQVFDNNPHIAKLPPVLPLGTIIYLPTQTSAPTQALTQLWD